MAALAPLLRLVLRYAPRGAVGAVGYALALLATFTAVVGEAIGRDQLTVADCSGPALNQVLQLVAVGQAFSAVVVIVIGIGLQWRQWQDDHGGAAALADDLVGIDTPTSNDGGEP